MNESEVLANRIDGRKAAEKEAADLCELYAETSGELLDKFGLETAILYLERVRDIMIAIRPPEPEEEEVEEDEWDTVRKWERSPAGYILVDIDAVAIQKTDKAIGFVSDAEDSIFWMPNSQIYAPEDIGKEELIGKWPVT